MIRKNRERKRMMSIAGGPAFNQSGLRFAKGDIEEQDEITLENEDPFFAAQQDLQNGLLNIRQTFNDRRNRNVYSSMVGANPYASQFAIDIPVKKTKPDPSQSCKVGGKSAPPQEESKGVEEEVKQEAQKVEQDEPVSTEKTKESTQPQIQSSSGHAKSEDKQEQQQESED
mmetsp:Transcript_3882/g.6599  ORF Transcript_3882/g.6599 Transcript_3882/m.6599 type:complete len:171 (-) Transcript_3882:544-1056(-)